MDHMEHLLLRSMKHIRSYALQVELALLRFSIYLQNLKTTMLNSFISTKHLKKQFISRISLIH